MARCEVCERTGIETNLITCGSLDIPMESYCLTHYIEHVRWAHHGHPLPGCLTVENARKALAAEAAKPRPASEEAR